MSQLTFGESFNKSDDLDQAGGDNAPKKDSWYKGRILSHSSINIYQTCPQKWKFRYIDKVPEKPRSYFSFGKSVHAGLEYLFSKTKMALPTIEEVIDQFKAVWIRDGYETPAQEKWFFKEGERILRGFYSKHKEDAKHVFKVELKFNIDIEGVPIMGFIDRIDQTRNGKLSVIDYKTGKAFDKSRVRQDPQLTMYQIACRQVLGKDVENLTFYHLNSLTPVTVPAHSEDLENNLKEKVVSVAKGISKSDFDPKPDPRGHCQWCDYVQICPAFVGKRVPLSLKPNMNFSPEMVDRYGKLDDRVNQLTKERDKLGESLRSQIENSGDNKLQGEHYLVSLKPDPDGGSPYLETTPLDTEDDR